jgi:catechol 2,3-dioxygenase-like lactoylglutathione lyase family enzyme
MPNRFYGAVVRTARIDAMRQFLSDTVGLGEPVVDSSFWLEYQFPSGAMVLAVELDETAEASGNGSRGNTAWCITVDDLDQFETKMDRHGFGAQGETDTPGGRRALVFHDPDGNRFMAIAAP